MSQSEANDILDVRRKRFCSRSHYVIGGLQVCEQPTCAMADALGGNVYGCRLKDYRNWVAVILDDRSDPQGT